MNEASDVPIVQNSKRDGAEFQVKRMKLDAVDVSYSIVNREGKVHRILKNISFCSEGGELTALMGASGVGKSTLLDLLAGRKIDGTWSGNIYLNGVLRSIKFNRESAYVVQDHILIPTLTVEESVRYAAWTRLPPTIDIQARTDELLRMMKLEHVKDSYVGDCMIKGISGGQAKRLSIAIEIVALPQLIFMDEPTSGLDSSIAYEVMSTVRDVITAERTCVCTVHQPSKDMFALFDRLVLLARGRCIYFGPAAEAVPYFTQPELGFKFDGGHKNPAEFVLEISTGQRLAEGLRVARQPDELEVLYKNSRYYRPTAPPSPAHQASSAVEESMEDPYALQGSERYASTLVTQCCMLIHRTWTARLRDQRDLSVQLAKTLLVTLLMSLTYYGAGDITGPFYVDGAITSESRSVCSFLFFFSITSMLSYGHMVPYLCERTRLYRRELASGAYAPMSYWVSMVVTLAPLQFALHLLTVTIVYCMVGLNSNAAVFCYFLFATFAGGMVSMLSALALAASTSSEAIAIALYPAQFLLFTPFSGYVIQNSDLPSYWKWMPSVSYPKWIFEGLMVNEWHQYSTDDAGQDTGNGDILQDYGFADFHRTDVFWIALLFATVFGVILYVGLLPPRNRLVKVADAANAVVVLSRSGSSTGSAVGIPSALLGTKSRKQRAAGGLKASLLEDGGVAEESKVVPEPAVEHMPLPSVESFRVSSGVVERAKGCLLVFQDVSYSITTKAAAGELNILKNVSGRALPGEMVALMGASGAGKTTLLDLLAQRKTTGSTSGAITYNGSADLPCTAYAMQDNVHMGVLTVKESLFYAAELRLSEYLSAAQKARRVDKVLHILGLQDVADNILGTDSIHGVSGGQLKRVSIGVEIINLPDLMFLDEPTTGLDSSIALEVMCAVRNLANQNRTVVCTIHQPSEECFALFDTLLLLAEGRVIYFGAAVTAAEYFAQSPYQFAMRPGANPADFVIAVAGAYVPAGDGRTVTGGELASYYAGTAAALLATAPIPAPPLDPLPSAATVPAPAEEEAGGDPELVNGYRTSLGHQVRVLLHRRALEVRRDRAPTIASFVRDFLVGFLYGSIYYQLDIGEDCDSSCYFDRTSLLFYSVMLVSMGRMAIISTLFADRLIYYRERAARAYSPLAYWVSVVVPRLPWLVLNVLFYSLGAYTLPGLRSGAGHYAVFFIVMLLAGYCGLFFAYLAMALAPSTAVAMSYLPITLLFNIFYAGYVVFIPAMDRWQACWLPYLSFYRYAFQGLVLNELQGNSDLPDYHHYINELGFDFISIQGCIGVLLLFVTLTAGAFYLALVHMDFEER